LGLAAGAYVLAVATTTYDSDGDTIAYEVELHPPDTPVVLDISSV
jgi:DNA-binding GntR family transcriptional regulator